MIAVDTNVLVRVLVDDPGEAAQVRAARACVRRARKVFVPQIVQAESVWVLESAYGLAKSQVIAVLGQLQHNLAFELQRRETFARALAAWRMGGADFADYLILAEPETAGRSLYTFDRKLGQAKGATLVRE